MGGERQVVGEVGKDAARVEKKGRRQVLKYFKG